MIRIAVLAGACIAFESPDRTVRLLAIGVFLAVTMPFIWLVWFGSEEALRKELG